MSIWRRLFKRGHKDPTTLGNLLVEFGLCSEEDIADALADDLMLGDALVRAEKLTERQLEVMLARQNLARGRCNGTRNLADIAIERTRESTGRWNAVGALAAAHGEKIK